MNELKISPNLETNLLNEQTNYRLTEIGKIKDYFESEIKDQEILIRKLSKYITGFDYTDKILEQDYLKQKKEKKHKKLLYFGKNKLDCIEMLISQAITDRIIDHQ